MAWCGLLEWVLEWGSPLPTSFPCDVWPQKNFTPRPQFLSSWKDRTSRGSRWDHTYGCSPMLAPQPQGDFLRCVSQEPRKTAESSAASHGGTTSCCFSGIFRKFLMSTKYNKWPKMYHADPDCVWREVGFEGVLGGSLGGPPAASGGIWAGSWMLDVAFSPNTPAARHTTGAIRGGHRSCSAAS